MFRKICSLRIHASYPPIPQPVSSLLFTLALFGKSLAIDCETGEFESNSVCVDCSAGYYNNATAQTDCTDECPTGTWSAAGASSCTDCTEGYTQLDFSTANDDASTCETGCDSGYSYSAFNNGLFWSEIWSKKRSKTRNLVIFGVLKTFFRIFF